MKDYPENVISAVVNDRDGDVDEVALVLADISTKHYELMCACRKWLDEHDRCDRCGQKLEVHRGKEYHPEVDAYEPYCEKYCPNCDLGG